MERRAERLDSGTDRMECLRGDEVRGEKGDRSNDSNAAFSDSPSTEDPSTPESESDNITWNREKGNI